MKSIITSVLLLSLTGCATTQYTVNGVEPKQNEMLKTVGTIVVLGVVAGALGGANKGKESCKSYVSGPSGNSVVTTYQTKCP